jgi:hypothetical protein
MVKIESCSAYLVNGWQWVGCILMVNMKIWVFLFIMAHLDLFILLFMKLICLPHHFQVEDFMLSIFLVDEVKIMVTGKGGLNCNLLKILVASQTLRRCSYLRSEECIKVIVIQEEIS